MTIVDVLKKRFPVFEVADLGECLTIPGEDFEPKWVLELLKQGYRFEGTRMDGIPTVLVQIKPLRGIRTMRNESIHSRAEVFA